MARLGSARAVARRAQLAAPSARGSPRCESISRIVALRRPGQFDSIQLDLVQLVRFGSIRCGSAQLGSAGKRTRGWQRRERRAPPARRARAQPRAAQARARAGTRQQPRSAEDLRQGRPALPAPCVRPSARHAGAGRGRGRGRGRGGVVVQAGVQGACRRGRVGADKTGVVAHFDREQREDARCRARRDPRRAERCAAPRGGRRAGHREYEVGGRVPRALREAEHHGLARGAAAGGA
jgi:hypothetical protein